MYIYEENNILLCSMWALESPDGLYPVEDTRYTQNVGTKEISSQ